MKPNFERNPYRKLPDGTIARVFPFHVSLEGLEDRLLCRSEKDYDTFVKIICICAYRKNVILIMYVVVSNHAHFVILARSQAEADSMAIEVKKMFSMYFNRTYDDRSVLKGVDAKALWLDNDWYLQNAIAYDIRNAFDNGAYSVQDYKWTGFRGMFCHGRVNTKVRKVRELSKREISKIMHTYDDLSHVDWLINEDNELEPASTCDWQYLEAAFGNCQSEFIKKIGTVNKAQMNQRLIKSSRTMLTDEEFMRLSCEVSQRWFQIDPHSLSIERKNRIIPYLFRIQKTSVSQIARVFEMKQEEVSQIIETCR